MMTPKNQSANVSQLYTLVSIKHHINFLEFLFVLDFCNNFTREFSYWGYNSFITWDDLINPANGYCKEGKVVLKAWINCSLSNATMMQKVYYDLKRKVEENQDEIQKWKSIYGNLMDQGKSKQQDELSQELERTKHENETLKKRLKDCDDKEKFLQNRLGSTLAYVEELKSEASRLKEELKKQLDYQNEMKIQETEKLENYWHKLQDANEKNMKSTKEKSLLEEKVTELTRENNWIKKQLEKCQKTNSQQDDDKDKAKDLKMRLLSAKKEYETLYKEKKIIATKLTKLQHKIEVTKHFARLLLLLKSNFISILMIICFF